MPVKTSRYCVYCGVLSTSHLGLLNSLSRRKLRFSKNCLQNLLRYRSFTPYPKNLTIFGDPKRLEPCADPRTFNFNSTLNDNKCLRHLVFDRFYVSSSMLNFCEKLRDASLRQRLRSCAFWKIKTARFRSPFPFPRNWQAVSWGPIVLSKYT